MEEKTESSFNEYFVQKAEDIHEQEQLTLEQKFASERQKWTGKIRDMSSMLRKVFDIPELMGTIYTDRQMALEYYHMLLSLLIRVNKEYRRQYAAKYDHYSFKGQKRFPNETTKNNQILSEMEDIISKKKSMDNMLKCMLETVKTIDNIIYGMKYRIDIEKISRGSL